MKSLLFALIILFGQQTGYVVQKTYEGGSTENDRYIVEVSDYHRYEIEADDLEEGDSVTVWFLFGQPALIKYRAN